MIDEVRYIITTKNNENIIENCINSILIQHKKNFPNISVVDDNSSDNTVSIIKNKYPFINIINCLENKGPSGNRNKAIFNSSEKYFVFMDSDAILNYEWTSNAYEFLEKNPEIGVLGGRIYGKDKKLQSAGGEFHYGGTGWLVDNNKFEYNDRFCFWMPSSTFIARSDVIKLIDGFDSDFIYLYEDLDICWRIWLSGYSVYFYSKLSSEHIMSYTTNKEYKSKYKTFLSKRNKITTLIKNSEIKVLLLSLPIIILVILGELIFLKNKFSIFKGNFFILSKLLKIIKKRSIILNKVKKENLKNIRKMYYKNHIQFIRMCLKL